jgi:hypothetical protein
MRPQHVLLSRRCPVCGGRSNAEGKLPLSQGIRTLELNLDEPVVLVETLSMHLLLALVELLPYKQFACQRCGHEFRMASQTSRELLYGLLTSMQPVTAPPPPAPPGAVAAPKRRVAPVVKSFPDGVPATAKPDTGKSRARPAMSKKPAEPQPGSPDWTPYHLDSDMDALFDQFKEE